MSEFLMNAQAPKLLERAVASTLMIVALSGLIACGGFKTDPTSEYADLNDAVPPGEAPTRTQNYVDSGIFRIETERSLDFIQGQSERYYIKPRLLLRGVQFTLEASETTGLPAGATFGPATEPERAGEYLLEWSPRPGLLSEQELIRAYKFKVEIKNLVAEDARTAQIMNQISHPRELELRVLRASEQPVIERVELGASEIVEGTTLAFSALVRDLGAYEGRPPRLLVDHESSAPNESPRVSAASHVRIDPRPEAVGGGRYLFRGRIDTRQLALSDQEGSSLARFVLVVVSPSGLPAPDQIVEFKIIKRPAASPTPPSPSAAAPSVVTGERS